MTDLFDSLKKNKKTTTGKRNARELSPVKFPFSDDEDSDDVVLKKPVKSPGRNGKLKMSPQTKRLLGLMKKCVVKLPKDKDGRLLQRIHAEWKKQRKNNKKGNKFPIVKLKKSFTISKSQKVKSPPKKQVKSPESTKKQAKTPESNKKVTPAKVYVKLPFSTPNSNKKKKVYAKTPLNKVQKPKPRGHDIASKRLNATPGLVREFGKRFFMCFVDIQDSNLVQLMRNPKSTPKKKKKLNSSVRFNETVEVFGTSDSENEDEEIADPMPVSLITALNGSYGSSTPSSKPKGKKVTSLEKKKPVLTPAAKKNYRLSDEKKANISNEEEEDDDAEYIGESFFFFVKL